jgi:hypothetical protein
MWKKVKRISRKSPLMILICLSISLVLSGTGLAQDDEDFLSKVSFNGWISQGMMWTSDNSYLTMDSSNGSLEWQDLALNANIILADKLRFGFQLFSRDLGEMSNHTPELDWAYLEYHLFDEFGLRIGKIKTPLGLYNDEQDLEFLHSWILFPQSLYPTNLRSLNLSHTGIDAYGQLGMGPLGYLNYQSYFGKREIDENDAMYRNLKLNGLDVSDFDVQWLVGTNIIWQTPLNGLSLTAGVSFDDFAYKGTSVDFQPGQGYGYNFMGMMGGVSPGTGNGGGPMGGHHAGGKVTPPIGSFFTVSTKDPRKIYRLGFEFEHSDLTLAAEYQQLKVTFEDDKGSIFPETDRRGYYLSGSYRINNLLEIGSYVSTLYPDYNLDTTDVNNFQNDYATSLRIDINNHWVFKTEYHRINGLGQGVFESNNLENVAPGWNLIACKLTFNF